MKLNDDIKIIISEIAEENGYDVVLPDSSTIFYQNKLDITKDVLARLNKKIPNRKTHVTNMWYDHLLI